MITLPNRNWWHGSRPSSGRFCVLALFSVAPLFSMRAVPMRAKIGLAFFVALCAQAVLTDQPVVSINGPQALVPLRSRWPSGWALALPCAWSLLPWSWRGRWWACRWA